MRPNVNSNRKMETIAMPGVQIFLIYSLKDTIKKENAPTDAQKSRKGNIMTRLGIGKRVVLQICLHLHNYNR